MQYQNWLPSDEKKRVIKVFEAEWLLSQAGRQFSFLMVQSTYRTYRGCTKTYRNTKQANKKDLQSSLNKRNWITRRGTRPAFCFFPSGGQFSKNNRSALQTKDKVDAEEIS